MLLGNIQRANNQQAPGTFEGDCSDRLGVIQLRQCQQRSDFWTRFVAVAAPTPGFSDVDKANRLLGNRRRTGRLGGQLIKQALLLRASNNQRIPGCPCILQRLLKRTGLATAQRGMKC